MMTNGGGRTSGSRHGAREWCHNEKPRELGRGKLAPLERDRVHVEVFVMT